jgi:hypothetical protein
MTFEYDFKDGDVVEDCNLSQVLPRTLITNKVVTFLRCNCTNVSAPNAVFEDCNQAQLDFCSNNPSRADLVEAGLPVCPVDCRHKNGEEYLDLDAK